MSYLTPAAAEAWCLEQLTRPGQRARPLGATCRSGFGSSTACSTGGTPPSSDEGGLTLRA